MAQAQPNYTMLALTPAQVASLPADQQAAYLASLSPQMLAIYQQSLIDSGNLDFMRNSIEHPVFCPVQGGSGQTAAYSPGQTLNFDFPTTAGYAKGLLISYNLTVTPATGASATYATTPAAPFNIFSKIEADVNGPQVFTHPYFACKVVDELAGYQKGAQNKVLAGNNDTDIAANVVGTTPLVVNSGNVWKGKMYLRLNPIGDESPFGLLPISGVGNRPQLKLTCANSFYGTDPLLNPVCSGGSGTGQAVTVTGTVSVDAIVLDGANMESVAGKSLQGLLGMPTIQYLWEQSLTPFSAGLTNAFQINTKLEHWMAVAVVIDGQQSNAFISANSNLTAFGMAADRTGQQYFHNYGFSNNISIYDWFDRYVRRPHGQDLTEEGVIPWVNAAGRGIVNASNRNGSQVLNMYSDGFPAASHLYQVGAVGSVCTPRVELFLISKNRQGLKVS